jgi:Rps23 Pro-64 3,4-dihydroxylase Tpa1-like proline 4-hydroxylase
MHIVDMDRLERQAPALQAAFAAAAPYPHIVLDDFLTQEAADALLAEFGGEDENWTAYNHYNERKAGLTRFELMGPQTQATIDALHSERFIAWLEKISGVSGLLSDPDLDGGGLHQIKRGGFLNMHVDFQSHTTRTSWSRQLNLLLYLNRDWQDEWEGFLELWDSDVKIRAARIKPIFNRCVLFLTAAEGSYHGHPAPLACPETESRKSLALYYFRDEGTALKLSPTLYKALPEDPWWKHALVAADVAVLRGYSFMKRHTPINDKMISRILRRFS